MEIIRTCAALDDALSSIRDSGQKIGFVPTMGALHDGHLSLVDTAKEHADVVVASIFVNPAQFAPHEDFDDYPREEEEDIAKFKSRGVDLVFIPDKAELYPDGMETDVKAGDAAKALETDFRPHFFDGVVNVVHRLFNAVRPDVAVFGEKDYQQLQVITEMVRNLDLPIEIIGAPIVRDDHGLALSSRNAYLSDEELTLARQFNVILREAAADGDLEKAQSKLLGAGFSKVDYIETRWNRILGATWVGKTRLIDNIACGS